VYKRPDLLSALLRRRPKASAVKAFTAVPVSARPSASAVPASKPIRATRSRKAATPSAS